jgi:hypothetical protein
MRKYNVIYADDESSSALRAALSACSFSSALTDEVTTFPESSPRRLKDLNKLAEEHSQQHCLCIHS